MDIEATICKCCGGRKEPSEPYCRSCRKGQYSEDCPICAGTGQNPAGNGIDCDDDPCPNCGGTGQA